VSRCIVALVGMTTLLSFPCLASNAAAAPPASFKAGFAERDITPELGMEAPGGYGKSHHRSVHDPCKVRAAVFDDGRSRVAIVGIDALGIRRDTVQKVRRSVQAKTGIPAGAILIGASHSHSSGPLVWTMRGEYDHASALVQRLAYEESTIADPRYVAQVEVALIDAICEANDRRVESRAGVGKGIEGTVAFNRGSS
jgi:neutral ceramidase